MKGKYCKILGSLTAVLTLLAAVFSSTACCTWGHQPRVPKAMRK